MGCYSKWAYHNLPGRKENVYKHNAQWRINNPERYKAINNKATVKYHNKINNNPELLTKFNEKQRKAYHKRKEDLVFKQRMYMYSKIKYLIKKNPELKPYRKEILSEYRLALRNNQNSNSNKLNE